jgi:hypothetical protein
MYMRLCPIQPAYTLKNVKKFKNARFNSPLKLSFCKMYVHWREREHEDIDSLVAEDLSTLTALAQCGLLKFFQCPFMWAQPRLLNALVDYWHPNAEAFMLKGQSLTPMTEGYLFSDWPLKERGTNQPSCFSSLASQH